MGRKSLKIESLYGYKIKDLVDLKNTVLSKYSRLVLTVITMRYQGYSNKDIVAATGLSKVSIVKHIKEWNAHGIKIIEDHRGGSESKLEAPEIDEFIYTVLNKSPVDFGFASHTWTLQLLSLYVHQTFGVKLCLETIRNMLLSHKISYKRAQSRPTKADKREQEEFKKKCRNY